MSEFRSRVLRLALVFTCISAATSGTVTAGEGSDDVPSVTDYETTLLPLNDFHDMVVDDDHERIYVTGGSSADRLLVVDFHGNVLRQIRHLPGAAGLLLDKNDLYVTLSNSNRVVRLDRETLEKTDSYVIGEIGAYQVVRAGSVLWVLTGDCDLYWIDPESGELGKTPFPESDQRRQQPGCTRLAGSDITDDLFWVDGYSDVLVKAEVQGNELTVVGEKDWLGRGHLELSVDADNLYVGGGAAVYRTDTFTQFESYGSGIGIAVPADEEHVLIGTEGSWGATDIRVYEAGASRPQLAMSMNWDVPYFDGLAMSADESRLFLVTNGLGEHAGFWAIRDPVATPTAASITEPPFWPPPTPHKPGERLSVEGEVRDPMTGDLMAGVPVDVLMDRPNDFTRKIASVTTDENGQYEIHHRPRSKTWYSAIVPRGMGYRTSVAERDPVIMRVEPPTRIDMFARGPVVPGQRFELRGELSDTWYGSRNRDVNLYKKVDGKKRWLFRRLRFSRDEREFLITTTLRRKTTFTAEWPGEPGFEPVSGRWTVRVNPA